MPSLGCGGERLHAWRDSWCNSGVRSRPGFMASAMDVVWKAGGVCGMATTVRARLWAASGPERAVSQVASGEVSTRQMEQVVHAVRHRIVDVHRALPEAFRPAHLSVALIDAVFNPRLHYASVVVPIVERYCCHFGLVRTLGFGGVSPSHRRSLSYEHAFGWTLAARSP